MFQSIILIFFFFSFLNDKKLKMGSRQFLYLDTKIDNASDFLHSLGILIHFFFYRYRFCFFFLSPLNLLLIIIIFSSTWPVHTQDFFLLTLFAFSKWVMTSLVCGGWNKQVYDKKNRKA